MRFSRGVVKIPVKYLYVFLIVVATTLFLYLYIRNYQRNNGQGQCRILQPTRTPTESKKSEGRSQNSNSVCAIEPEFTRFEDCPHCFRPNVQNIANQLYQVQYSTSIFPRGPPDLFKPRNEIQQDFITDYLITPSSVCTDKCPYLVAILLSIASEVEQRNAVRATWASVAKTRLWPHSEVNAEIQVLFVLAHQTPQSYISSSDQQIPKKIADKEYFPTLREWTRIKSEADIHGDILYLNMQDSYFNLTLKLVSSFKWVADHCTKVKYFLKVDMDTFVSVPLLIDMLIVSEDRLEYAIVGQVYTNNRVVRRANKWAVDAEVYPPAIFPVYASGCAYVISQLALLALTEVFPYFPEFQIEDAFITGVLARVVRIQHIMVGNSMFTHNMDYNWSRCDFVNYLKVVGTGVNFPFKLRNLWASFVYDDGKCSLYDLISMTCYCSRNQTY